jgi:hypothetical protein
MSAATLETTANCNARIAQNRIFFSIGLLGNVGIWLSKSQPKVSRPEVKSKGVDIVFLFSEQL